MTVKLLKLKEVIELGVGSKTTIYKLLKENKFPKPIKCGTHNRWVLSDIQNWIDENNPNHEKIIHQE